MPIALFQCLVKKGLLGEMRHHWLFSLAVLFIIYLESLPQSPRGGILSPLLEVVVSQKSVWKGQPLQSRGRSHSTSQFTKHMQAMAPHS